jgi:hypothetical protein
MSHWSDALVSLGACRASVEWAKTQPDLETAWATCERGDWMLWLVGKTADTYQKEYYRRKLLNEINDVAALAGRFILRFEKSSMCTDIIRKHYPEPPTMEEVQS